MAQYPFNVPHVLTKYTLTKKLGAGGFGAVYACETDTRNDLVMKVCPKGIQFQQEAEILKIFIGKKNVCQLVEAFETPTHFCIVMVNGGMELQQAMIVYKEKFNSNRISYIVSRILRGLHSMHFRDCVHTDLKPANITIDEITNAATIIDLGNAIPDKMNYVGLVQTRPFRAPEIMLQFPTKTHCDIWSLGCIVFEMFTRNNLFFPYNPDVVSFYTGKFPITKSTIHIPTGSGDDVDDYAHLELISKILNQEFPSTLNNSKFLDADNKLRYQQFTITQDPNYPTLLHKMLEGSKATPGAIDFIMKCLRINPAERLTVVELSGHDWVLRKVE